jgi:hypothetical protein
MDRETVTQYRWGERFGETGAPAGTMTGLFDGGASERVVRSLARKQPGGGPVQAPPVPQDREQLGREHHVPIALPFALLDANDHALTVEIAWVDPDVLDEFRKEARPRRVGYQTLMNEALAKHIGKNVA